MQQYYFLFALAFVWTLFATIQDIKKREVANWLNFSLIAFALAYRAFYAIHFNNPQFFVLGFLGVAIFVALAHALYYGKAFAGGDAKLLMGFGAILPFTSYYSLLTLSISFIFILFLIGAIYSLIYSAFIASKNKKKFVKDFKKRFKKSKSSQITFQIAFVIATILGFLHPAFFLLSIFALLPTLLIYTKSVDICMTALLPPSKLTEGDWIENSITIGKKKIKKTVHGLTLEDIKLLKKHNKKILVKQGIPFVPAFLIALILMLYIFFSGFSFPYLF